MPRPVPVLAARFAVLEPGRFELRTVPNGAGGLAATFELLPTQMASRGAAP